MGRSDRRGGDETDRGEGELKTTVFHSPFGILNYVRKELQLTRQELLWGVPWITMLLEIADTPREGKKSETVIPPTDELDTDLIDHINNTTI